MWPRPKGEQRSQSEILGTILVFSLVIVVGTVLVTAGIALFDDASQEFEDSQGQDGVQEINNRLSTVGDAGTVIDIPNLGSEGTSFERDAGNVTVNVTTIKEAFDVGGNTRLIDETQIVADDMNNETSFNLGEVVHESDGGVNTVFQGGLLFEREGSEISILDEPSFDFVKGEGTFRSIDFSFVSLAELGNLNSETYVERDDTESTRISGEIQEMVRKQRQLTGIPDRDPTASVFINVSIETEYPEAWERYVTERMSVTLPDSQVDVTGDSVDIRFPEFRGNDLEEVEFPKNVVYSGKAGVASVFYTTDEFSVDLENRDTGFEVEEFEGTPPTIGGGADEYAPVIAEDGEWWVYDPTAASDSDRWVTVNDTETRAWSSMSGIDTSTPPTDRSSHEWGFADDTTVCMVGFENGPSSTPNANTELERIQKVVADGQCGELTVGTNNPPEQESEMIVDGFTPPGTVAQGNTGTVVSQINNTGDSVVKVSPIGLFGDLGGSEKEIVGYNTTDLYPYEDPKERDLSFTAVAQLNQNEPLEIRTVDDTQDVSFSVSGVPEFEVNDVRGVGPGAVPGEPYTVEADIENVGGPGEQTVTLTDVTSSDSDDHRAVDTTDVTISSGSTKTVTLTWNVPVTADVPDSEVEVSTRKNSMVFDVPRKPAAIIDDIRIPNIEPGEEYGDEVPPIEVDLTNPSESKVRKDADIELDTTRNDLHSIFSSTGVSANPGGSATATNIDPNRTIGYSEFGYSLDVSNVNEIKVWLTGASGEALNYPGGDGGYISGTVDVSSDSELRFYPGQRGDDPAGDGLQTGGIGGGEGAGSTVIRTGAGEFIAAADGGGGGWYSPQSEYGGGGAAGGDGENNGNDGGDRSVSVPTLGQEYGSPVTASVVNAGGDGGTPSSPDGKPGGYVYNDAPGRFTVDTAGVGDGSDDFNGDLAGNGFIGYKVTDTETAAIDIGIQSPIGTSQTVDYEVKARDAATGNVNDVTGSATVTSSDPSTVSVDQGNNEVRTQSTGSGITITAQYGGKTATTTVDVISSTTVLTKTVDVPTTGTSTVSFEPSLSSNPITDWVPIQSGTDRLTPDDENESVGIVERSGPKCSQVNYDGGSGTSVDPYQISNVDQLQCIDDEEPVPGHNSWEDSLGADYRMVDDVAAHGTEYWNSGNGFMPIGELDADSDAGTAFTGDFDGGGHMIQGLTIDRYDDAFVGLFAITAKFAGSSGLGEGVTIENLVLDDIDVRGMTVVGGLVGGAGGKFRQISVDGDVESQYQQVGGLIGHAHDGDLTNELVSTANVSGNEPVVLSSTDEHPWQDTTSQPNLGIGGLLGGMGYDTEFSVGYSRASVSGPSSVGGITGWTSNEPSDLEQMYWADGTLSLVDSPEVFSGTDRDQFTSPLRTGGIAGRIGEASGPLDTIFSSVYSDGPTVGDGGTNVNDNSVDLDADKMTGPQVLPDPASSHDFTQYSCCDGADAQQEFFAQYPGVEPSDAQGTMAELDWDIWEPVYDTEVNTATGTVDIVNEGYPVFEWESEGFVTVGIDSISPDVNSSKPGIQFLPGTDDGNPNLQVDATVTNVGETPEQQAVLLIDPRKDSEAVVDTETVNLNPGQSKPVSFTWSTSKGDRLSDTQPPSEAEVVVQTEDFLDAQGIELLEFKETNLELPDGLDVNETVDVFNTTVVNGSETTDPTTQFNITSDGGRLHLIDEAKFEGEQVALLADGRVVDVTKVDPLEDDSNELELSWTPRLGQSGTVTLTVQVVGTDVKVSDTIFVAAPAKSFSDAGLSPINTGVDIISGSG
jgi:hypothetical protein